MPGKSRKSRKMKVGGWGEDNPVFSTTPSDVITPYRDDEFEQIANFPATQTIRSMIERRPRMQFNRENLTKFGTPNWNIPRPDMSNWNMPRPSMPHMSNWNIPRPSMPNMSNWNMPRFTKRNQQNWPQRQSIGGKNITRKNKSRKNKSRKIRGGYVSSKANYIQKQNQKLLAKKKKEEPQSVMQEEQPQQQYGQQT